MALTTNQAIDQAKKQLSDLVERKPSSVVAVSRDEEGWHVSLEMLEKKSIPDRMDLLARYDVLLDDEGNVMKFNRGDLRTRGDATKYEGE
ncbi:MAG: gas vesicle protein [Chloroflexi bacterium]|nr:gas vesicle protein [Chloroflexota bacterium]